MEKELTKYICKDVVNNIILQYLLPCKITEAVKPITDIYNSLHSYHNEESYLIDFRMFMQYNIYCYLCHRKSKIFTRFMYDTKICISCFKNNPRIIEFKYPRIERQYKDWFRLLDH